MSHNYSTTITPDRERGQHLKFGDRVSIKIYKKQGHTLRFIAEIIDCSPSTIMYELRRGTGQRNGSRGRFPEYSAKRGQANYEMNRSRCHRKAKALNGKESVVFTLIEKKTEYYMAIKIPGRNADSVMAAVEVLREEFGDEYFHLVFKSITADNGSEFSRLSELEAYGVSVYFAHPYSSWERPQNERHNRIFRRFIPKGVSIERYSAEQLLCFADEMHVLPRKQLGYQTPEELFEEFLDKVYSINSTQVT